MNLVEAKDLLKQCGGNRTEAARRAGLPRSTFIDRLTGRPEGARRGQRPTCNAERGTADVEMVSRAELVGRFDLVGRAVATIRALPAGKFLTDEGLRHALAIGDGRLARMKRAPALASFWTLLPDRKVVWGRADSIAELMAEMRELV